MEEPEKDLSTRSVALWFMLGVAVCGVFFSLGFLLGYKERSSSRMAEVERVTTPGDTPPVVNAPPEKEEVSPPPVATSPIAIPTAQPPLAESGQATGDRAPHAPASTQPGAAVKSAVQGPASVGGNHASREAPAPALSGRPVTSGVTLQVAALQTRQDAEVLVKVLKERGYPVLLVTPEDAHANDNLFRVRVGPFTSHDDEEKTRQKLVQEGFKPFVKR